MQDIVLDVQNLSHSYGGMPVWENVTFSVEAGQVALLAGPNGSGKTTLLKCVAGWIAPTSGTVSVSPGSSRVVRAFVSDTPAFYDDFTAREHIELLVKAGRMPERTDYAQTLLESFGLARCLDQYPSSYSRGMRQKLALVLALTIHPRLLLLDEPYAVLDRESSALVDDELSRIAVDGTAVLMSSHMRPPGLCPDHTLYLRDGRLTHA